MNGRAWLVAAACGGCLSAFAGNAGAQAVVGEQKDSDVDVAGPMAHFDGRPISDVRFEGLGDELAQFVRNQLRTQVGGAFRAQTVTDDIHRLYRTGRFGQVDASVEELADGFVRVVYTLTPALIIVDVQVVGNRNVSDQELAGISDLLRGTPADEFQIARTRRAIEELYRAEGYYQARVEIDREQLAEGVVLYRIREGEKLKVTEIRFSGSESIPIGQLRQQIKTKTSNIFRSGPLDDDRLELDVVALSRFYRDRGFLDVRADRLITPSPDGKEAIVTFVIDEGPRYTLRSVVTKELDGDELVISLEQIQGLMELKPGDVYGVSSLRRSTEAVQDALWRLGYVDASVGARELRDVEKPEVDLVLTISQGQRFRTGEVVIQGNHITRQNVIRRHVQIRPDRPLDRAALDETRRRIDTTRLFDRASPTRVTIQPESPDSPGYRDVLIEVTETNTGTFNFGAAVTSDAGVIGTISVRERNFDVLDLPGSFDSLFSRTNFRGGGQDFSLTLAPGFEVQTYSVSLTEPYLFDSDYSLTVAGFFRDRRFDDHDEQRLGGRVRLGRRLGDRWTGGVSLRAEQVELDDLDDDAAVDFFEVEDANILLGIALDVTRTTVPPTERLYPTRGARTELSVEQVFGDFTFTKFRAEHEFWAPFYEDYLGRKGVFSMRTAMSFIPQSDEAPVYERFYLGGRNFRGFDFRGVSPRGIRSDTGTVGNDPVGGEWSFFLGAEYQHPIWGNVDGKPVMGLVGFIDTGTVANDAGFDDYRVSVGVGVRLLLPISPAPLAFDFGFPIVSKDEDEEEFFSFSVDLPF